jgi:aminoglycoside phosphotransferase (APT) family kinase protein
MLSTETLDATNVVAYLRHRGLDVPVQARVTDLSDAGVSSIVFAVAGPDPDDAGVIVKRARGELAVAERWTAPRQRTVTEGHALALATQVAPDWSPPLLDLDEDTMTVSMRRAPANWQTWKRLLLSGDPRPEVASRQGRLLAAWHGTTSTHPDAMSRFDQNDAFEKLRVAPYYRVAAGRNPEVRSNVKAVCERMLATRTALVHGDFSPKNILVGDGSWLIDFEVAHVGDPAFDLAFLLHHLALKSIHLPRMAQGFRLAADAFLMAYGSTAHDALTDVANSQHLFEQLGCLMLARVDGKSPVEYLDAAGRDRARRVAKSLLLDPVEDVSGAWRRMATSAVADERTG